MNLITSIKWTKQRWQRDRLIIIKIPSFSFRWRTLDFRPWYYVWIDDEKMPWWAHGNELDELREEYGNIQFKKIPWRKTILKY